MDSMPSVGEIPKSQLSSCMPNSGRATLRSDRARRPFSTSQSPDPNALNAEHRERSVTPIPQLPGLSSGSNTSLENYVSSSPISFLTDELALGGTTDAQHKVKYCGPPTSVGPTQSDLFGTTQDMWSDFIVPEHLHSSETIQPCLSQDFHASVILQHPLPDVISPSWPEFQPLLPLVNDDHVVLDYQVINQPNQRGTLDTISDENGSTGTTFEARIAEGTRFRHRLNAPPALQKESGESPVTYLNKGSPYSLLIEDTSDFASRPSNMVYCTSVRVAFDAEYQRQHPARYWRLWEQDRGTGGDHLLEGRSRAIEYVNSSNPDSQSDLPDLQGVHSDGFSLVWGAERSDLRQFSIAFQLNFLSTDFSYLKGVSGVALRLCSKTEEISTRSLEYPMTDPGMNYCRIKLFRSHGAERKTSNDIATAERRIQRLKQQLCQSRLPKDKGRRKDKRRKAPRLSGETVKRAPKADEDGLCSRIQNLQKILGCTQSHSFLNQQGDKQESYDCYPPECEHKSPKSPELGPTWCSWEEWSASMSIVLNPTDPVSLSYRTQHPLSPLIHGPQQKAPASTRSKIVGSKSKNLGYNAVACFYIRPLDSEEMVQNDSYTTIYLFERTACELASQIAVAVSIDPANVVRVTWRSAKGFNVVVDNDVVANMPEGQEMQIAVTDVISEFHSEVHSSVPCVAQANPCVEKNSEDMQKRLELKLLF